MTTGKKASAGDDEVISQAEFARRIDKSPAYVCNLKKRGCLALADNGKILYRASLEKMGESVDVTVFSPNRKPGAQMPAATDRQPASITGSDSGGMPGSYIESKTLEKHYDAKIKRAKYLELMGELVAVEQVREVIFNASVLLRQHLEQLADTLAPRICQSEDENEIRALLLEEVEYALGNLAQTLRQYAEQSKQEKIS